MTCADLIEVLKQCPESLAQVKLRTRDEHDWIVWVDITDVTFNEREQTVILDAEAP